MNSNQTLRWLEQNVKDGAKLEEALQKLAEKKFSCIEKPPAEPSNDKDLLREFVCSKKVDVNIVGFKRVGVRFAADPGGSISGVRYNSGSVGL
jgi:hypothetical protein